tara:strand:+ start:968 stop:1192 length:225 start_codon:yes stop_codon:yes gene_type:complete
MKDESEMKYMDWKALHIEKYGRVVLGKRPFDHGKYYRLVTGQSWCGFDEDMAIKFEASCKEIERKYRRQKSEEN